MSDGIGWRGASLLFAATFLTTTFSGAFWAGVPVDVTDLPRLWKAHLLLPTMRAGLPFSVTLLSILLAHELGHYFAARHHQVDCTPPLFLPLPLLIGTLGAVIRMKGRIPSRRALFDIGASGPWAGFILAAPLFALGVSWSEPMKVPAASDGFPSGSLWGLLSLWRSGALDEAGGMLVEGRSLLVQLVRAAATDGLPPGHDLMLHPVAAAAWFGLFITGLNLLPVGQLDGGHVVFSLSDRHARRAGRVVVGLLVLLGIFSWAGWLLWSFIAGRLVGTGHPAVEDDTPLDPLRRRLAIVSIALFVLTFVPLPMEVR